VKLEGAKRENLPFSARMEIDYTQERAQIFGEAWRVLNAGFYDPNFHGQDWAALSEKYWAWGRRASTSRDFRDVFNMMLGELNASHLGLRGSDRAETQNERTGLLGVEIDPVDSGVRVERVVPNSPADRAASKLEQGDVITAVEGMPVTQGANFYAVLADRVDQRTVLSVRGANGREREVVIRPTGSLFRLLYEEWVADRRDLTERYSGGRLGYIHIQGMNWPSFERFERELVASGNGKDGIVIDVRFNGGGWTTDYLMAVLTVRQHAYTVPRGAADDLATQHTQFRTHYPFGERLPLAAWTKPSIALCNANSFSNAEIFSHAFKHVGLGTLVGEPTFGAVISTGGAGLIDGSFVRLPFRGWFVKATEENMENGPALPDIVIMGRPDDRAAGEDAQLRAAVDELLRQIDGAAGGSR
jgi:tricorn protease